MYNHNIQYTITVSGTRCFLHNAYSLQRKMSERINP